MFGWHSSVLGLNRLQAGLVLSSSATHITLSYSEQNPSDLTCLAGKRFDFHPMIQTPMWVGIWLQMQGAREKCRGSDICTPAIADLLCELGQLTSPSPPVKWKNNIHPELLLRDLAKKGQVRYTPSKSTFPSAGAWQVGVGLWSSPGFWKSRRQLPLPSGFKDPERWAESP